MPYTFDTVNTAKLARVVALLTEARTLLDELYSLPLSEPFALLLGNALDNTDEATMGASKAREVVGE